QMLVPVSMGLSGVLVDTFSVAGLFAAAGVIMSALGFAISLSRSIRTLYQPAGAEGEVLLDG
ncbi:MAG: hypothetical protein GX199_08720, partial [Firmicutes bacterium]|nr:hypothetical protein [Bacillota bacterium]